MNGSGQQFPQRHPPALRGRAPGRRRLLWGRAFLLVVLGVQLLIGWGAPAAAFSLPWGSDRDPSPSALVERLALLQEVSPPPAVRQLQSALAARQPVVEILSPEDDALLERGPWRLELRVHDWPLVDGGALGLGPHLVVQVDGDPPQIWTKTEGLMPELSPGSHRLTVYAALPWGEARKDPGAVRQIRLHRTAANPLVLPAPGSPQLLAVSPPPHGGPEPLLLDWLLLDAPLQNVAGSGVQWRLRAEINGDTVLLEQPTALWLNGWKPGLNSVRLDVLDGRGSPLNPPFNSVVREVDRSSPPPPARWRGEHLSPQELAVLLGQVPADSPPTATALSTAIAEQPSPPAVLPMSSGPAGEETVRPEEASPSEQALGERVPGSEQPSPEMAEPSPPALTSQVSPRESSISTPVPGIPSDGRPPHLLDAGLEPESGSTSTPGRAPEADLLARSEALAEDGARPLLPASQVPQAGWTASPAEGAPADGASDADGVPADAIGRAGAGPLMPGSDPDMGESQEAELPQEAQDPASRAPVDGAAAAPTAEDHGEGQLRDAPERRDIPVQAGTPPPGAIGQPAPAPQGDLRSPPPPSATAAPPPAGEAPGPLLAPGVDQESIPEVALEPVPDADASVLPSPSPAEAVPIEGTERIRTSSTLSGRARDLVNEDGTLRRPDPRGPLAALRDRWQR